jgi:putative transposase
VRYVERNPVRAGLAPRAEEYEWSSAAGHCGLRRDGVLAQDFPPRGVAADWGERLAADEDAPQVAALRRQTHTGRPCGGEGFVERLEGLLERVLRPGKRGRKVKGEVEALKRGRRG